MIPIILVIRKQQANHNTGIGKGAKYVPNHMCHIQTTTPRNNQQPIQLNLHITISRHDPVYLAIVSYLDIYMYIYIYISGSGLLYVLHIEIQDLSNMDEILNTCHKEWISIQVITGV